MQLWKIESLGISSEDFINRDSQNTPKAFYGVLWKFAKDRTKNFIGQGQTHPATTPQASVDSGLMPKGFLQRAQQEDLAKAQKHRQAPLDNHLVDEARRLGQPVAESDTGWTDEHAKLQEDGNRVLADNYNALHGSSKMTEVQLSAMTRDQLVDIASAMGVVNLDLGKKKLVEAILSKQG